MSIESTETLARLRTGDAVEVSEFFTRMRPHVRRMIDRRLDPRVRPRLDASDIVQEALLRASAGLAAYLKDPRVPPVVWLRLIGKRVAAEAHRKQFRAKRHPGREIDWDSVSGDMVVNRIADSMNSVWRAVAHEEVVERVRSALAELPEVDREIIEMRHLDEYTLTEAAAALDLTVEAAKKRYYRALRRFRSHAEGE